MKRDEMLYPYGKPIPKEADFVSLADDAPVLILSTDQVYKFEPGLNWEIGRHQFGGMANRSEVLCFTRIPLSDWVHAQANALCQHYKGSNLGAFNKPSLPEIMAYRRQLRRLLQVDCQHAFYDLAEAQYPIDVTHANIEQLSYQTFPSSLASLIDWGKNQRGLKAADFRLLLICNNHI